LPQETIAPEAAKKFLPDSLTGFRDYFDDLGTVKTVELLERRDEDGARTYRYRVDFENQKQVFVFRLDGQGKISDFYFE
jgi:hypothetical protein